MSKAEYPVTQAVRFLRSKKIDFVPYVYAYEEHGGTARFAECTGKPEHQVIKTIVLQDEHKKGLVVLMHGDKHISTRNTSSRQRRIRRRNGQDIWSAVRRHSV